MKKITKEKKYIFLIFLLIGLFIFLEIKNTVTGEKMNILSRIYFSDRGYAKNIEIKTYILTEEQVVNLFAHPSDEIHQLTRGELYKKERYMVFRFKNHGEKKAWGTLYDGDHDEFLGSTDIVTLPPASQDSSYFDYVLPMGLDYCMRNADEGKDKLPEIVVKWKSLFTKRYREAEEKL